MNTQNSTDALVADTGENDQEGSKTATEKSEESDLSWLPTSKIDPYTGEAIELTYGW